MKTKLCISLIGKSIRELEEKAEKALGLGADLIEFRLDYIEKLDVRMIKDLLSSYAERSIVTLRPSWEGGGYDGSEEKRLEILERLSEEKPLYMDLELGTSGLEKISRILRERSRLIISRHDFSKTPDERALRLDAVKALSYGDIAKIVTTARSFSDNLRILSLYRDGVPPERLIAFAMGEDGIVSRILSPILGAPIAYACLPGERAAPGQLAFQEFNELLRMVMG